MASEKIPFDPKELEVVGHYKGFAPGSTGVPILNTPITAKENLKRFAFSDNPLWMPSYAEFALFNPRLIPDNYARAIVAEAEPWTGMGDDVFHKDLFGVEWEFVPTVGGSMVRPGKPFIEDLADWESKVIFPDFSKLDWEGCVEKNKDYFMPGRAYRTTVFTGFFERLISFIDMTPALLALIDEDDQKYVHGIFDRLATIYDEMFSYFAKYFPQVDGVWFHDDWGSQRAPLFSADTCREMLVPYIKRVVESAHKYGLAFELHCCGKDELLVPCMIEAGVDMWAGQPMNDFEALYKEYGQDIKLGVEFDPIPENATDAQIREAACKFLDKYPNNVFLGMSPYAHPDLAVAVYEETRKRW